MDEVKRNQAHIERLHGLLTMKLSSDPSGKIAATAMVAEALGVSCRKCGARPGEECAIG